MEYYRILSLNLLTDYLYPYGKNLFSNRQTAIVKLIKQYNPDLIGLQEYTKNMNVLLDEFPEYGFIGEPRLNHDCFYNESTPVLYRKERFALLEEKTIWLSPTPSVRGSKYWNTLFPRIMTYVKLKERESGLEFYFANTHLDHTFASARYKQVEVIMKHLGENTPTILCGDFNDTSKSKTIQLLKERYYDTISDHIQSTLRYPLGSLRAKRLPIDHIFISSNFTCLNAQKCIDCYEGIYPSDHYPIFALLKEKDLAILNE